MNKAILKEIESLITTGIPAKISLGEFNRKILASFFIGSMGIPVDIEMMKQHTGLTDKELRVLIPEFLERTLIVTKDNPLSTDIFYALNMPRDTAEEIAAKNEERNNETDTDSE